MDGELKKRLDIGIEEFLLLFIVLLESGEFFGLLTVDLNYVVKIVSWICVGYLLYKVDLTEVFFGLKDRIIDIMLIIAYFMLSMKDFVMMAKTAADSLPPYGTATSYFPEFYQYIANNGMAIELWTFYIGGSILILLALLNIFLNVDIRAPSLMAIFHRTGEARNAAEKVSRALTSFVVYVAFYIVFFNLVIEWLGWALDSAVTVFGVFFYLLVFVKHAKKFDPQSYIYKIGDIGNDFYENFIKFFHSKGTLLLAVSGLLVLHLLTDIGIFIFPYVTGKEIEYFISLGAGHTVIPTLMMMDLSIARGLASEIAVVFIYVFNIAAMLALFAGPAFLWFKRYKKEEIDFPKIGLGIFISSIFVIAVAPIFRLQSIKSDLFYGVDILTKTIETAGSVMIMTTAIVVCLLIFVLSYNKLVKKMILLASVFLVNLFFGYYIYLFFMDIFRFYSKAFAAVSDYFIIFYFFMFVLITAVFYLSGFFYLAYSTVHDVVKRFI